MPSGDVTALPGGRLYTPREGAHGADLRTVSVYREVGRAVELLEADLEA